MHSVEYYVHKIKSKSPKVKYIHLTNRDLTDADIAPLLQALTDNPDIAERIVEIHLNGNKLKVLNLDGFTSLRKLHVAHNCLYELNLHNLPAITHLYASDNDLHTVEIYHLSTLKVVSLQNNKLVSAHINHLDALKKFGICNNDLTSAGKSALKAVNIQDAHLKVYISDQESETTALKIKLPKVNEAILKVHFQVFCKNLFPDEIKSQIFAVVHCLFFNAAYKIPADIIAYTLDYLIPKSYSLALEREIQNLRVSFTRRPGIVYPVNPPPSRSMPALHILNEYAKSSEFKSLRNRATRPLVFMAQGYCESINKLLVSKQEQQSADAQAPTEDRLKLR